MVADNFRDQRQSQTGAVALIRHERFEDVLEQIRFDAVAVILDFDQQRQADAGAAAWNG